MEVGGGPSIIPFEWIKRMPIYVKALVAKAFEAFTNLQSIYRNRQQ
jgi:hypothetical protein